MASFVNDIYNYLKKKNREKFKGIGKFRVRGLGVCADRCSHRWVTRGITCNLVTPGAPVTLNRSLITVPVRIGSLAALSRATPCKLISAVLSLLFQVLRCIWDKIPLLEERDHGNAEPTVDIPESLAKEVTRQFPYLALWQNLLL